MENGLQVHESLIEKHGLKGQQALLGFQPINIRAELGCDEIEQLENTARVSAAIEQIKQKTRWEHVRIEKEQWESGVFIRIYKLDLPWYASLCDYDFYKTELVKTVQCIASSESLTSYSEEKIPDEVLVKIDNAVEHGIPIKDMRVYYPKLEARVQKDPIVAFKRGNKTFLIARW